jgi:Tfp pilus assembly major pilin PilA
MRRFENEYADMWPADLLTTTATTTSTTATTTTTTNVTTSTTTTTNNNNKHAHAGIQWLFYTSTSPNWYSRNRSIEAQSN